MRLSPFFRHCETAQISHFFHKFFHCSPMNFFGILQQNRCSKNPEGSPFYIFWHYATYPRVQKNFKKNFGENFSSIFSFLRAFVVSSCRKSDCDFRVLLSLRNGADLGRSRLVRSCGTFENSFRIWQKAFLKSQVCSFGGFRSTVNVLKVSQQCLLAYLKTCFL